ncbi:MAG: 4Fe-4S binding protein [Deltaproteobacteria bacterium]|nr:4Fe-4S binding protein [Deltaproteobacteria bacterium]
MTPTPQLVQIRRPSPRRANRFAPWRIATLIAIHLLAAAHLAHWLIAGRTLAPLELNEVLHTMHAGIVTAGFLLMAVAALATVVFGRFFCGWGCHVLALQDLAAGILARLRLRPRPIESRALALVAPAALVYLFVWPQLERIAAGRPMPVLRVLDDSRGGWSSFVTADPWRNLPGPGIAIATLLVCGVVVVYVLGTRSFCRLACPYGALFGILDRFAPGRIVARSRDCGDCRRCTAVCQSGIRVHEEIRTYGKVVNPRCLRDLDCVAACPKDALRFGLTRPPLFGAPAATANQVPTKTEEVVAAVVCAATVLATRGLYETVSFLLAIGLGCLAAGVAVLALRVARKQPVRLGGLVLGQKGSVSAAGSVFLGASAIAALLLAHSAFVRLAEIRADAALARARADVAALAEADAHVRACRTWGIVAPVTRERRLASIAIGHGVLPTAEGALRRVLSDEPDDVEARMRLAAVLTRSGRAADAVRELRIATNARPRDARLQADLGVALAMAGSTDAARRALTIAVRIDPGLAVAHTNLGLLLADRGDLAGAGRHLASAVRLDPSDVRARAALRMVNRLESR